MMIITILIFLKAMALIEVNIHQSVPFSNEILYLSEGLEENHMVEISTSSNLEDLDYVHRNFWVVCSCSDQLTFLSSFLSSKRNVCVLHS